MAKLPTAAASLLAGARGCDCGGALHAPALVQYLAQYCTTVPPIGKRHFSAVRKPPTTPIAIRVAIRAEAATRLLKCFWPRKV